MSPFDVIIVGLGAMGSAAAYELGRRGVRVLGLDAHRPPHTLGSTHGRTRIIREAYFEHPAYVPLLRRAYERWSELEQAGGVQLLLQTGGLMIGPPGGTLVHGARASAEVHGIRHEMMDASEVRRRWPVMRPRDDMVALLEPRAGMLLPETCVETHLRLAREHGATLRTGVRVSRWTATSSAVRVETADGRSYEAGRLILAAGPWLPDLLDVPLGLEVERQLFHWFEPGAHGEAFAAARCPITLWEHEPGRYFATLSDVGDGLKIGIHHEGERAHPDDVRRGPSASDEAAVRTLLARFLPDANGRLREARACLYTNTPDHHFLLDRHPSWPSVIVASPCSGHGFKFSSVIGEVLADLATSGTSPFDLRLFGAERLLAHLRSSSAGSILPA